MAADSPLSPLPGTNNKAPALSGSLGQTQSFLPADQAFELSAWLSQDSAEQSGQTLSLHWQIAEGYYLYRHRLQIKDGRTGLALTPDLPPGQPKHDEYFGDVQVYYDQLRLDLPATALAGSESGQPQLSISYQGCADAGLCYPPQTLYLDRAGDTLTLGPGAPQAGAPEMAGSGALNERFLSTLASAHLGTIIAVFLLAGLALTFTPCVLPMMPILSGIIVGQSPPAGRSRAFSLSLTYVLAMAATYAFAGTLTGYFGAGLNLQLKLQSPWIIAATAAMFVLFALSMFGFFELRLPHLLHHRVHQISHRQRGGTYVGVALIGVLSTLIVSPCVTAPLAATLVFISSTGNPFLGGLALFSLGLGMGMPLLLVGTFGTQLLPRAGAWMHQIKIIFGILLLGVAIWMLGRLLAPPVTLALWVLLLTGYAIYLGVFKLLHPRLTAGRLAYLGLLLIAYSSLLTVNAVQGHYNPFSPFKPFAENEQTLTFQAVDSLQDIEQALANADGKAVAMLDLYADWCVSCRELEQDVFPAPGVRELLAQLTLLRADITRDSPAHQALLRHFKLFGPPSLLFFDASTNELKSFRIQGEIDRKALRQHLQQVLETAQRQ